MLYLRGLCGQCQSEGLRVQLLACGLVRRGGSAGAVCVAVLCGANRSGQSVQDRRGSVTATATVT
eukprot:COSAG02_NODE_3010_length_7554_cov_14.731590_3_plen_65_part_00